MEDTLFGYGALIGFAMTLVGWLAGCWFTGRSLVDPWELQARLMRISDQHSPDLPVLTPSGIMYAALIIEEAGELAETMRNAIAESPVLAEYPLSVQSRALEDHFSRLSNQLKIGSKRIRDEVENMRVFGSPISRGVAISLLDDATDIMVVTAGFSLATGLPGPEGYREVQRSNHSKANPSTGRIDKDLSGKWIKGPAYAPPDLNPLFEKQLDENQPG